MVADLIYWTFVGATGVQLFFWLFFFRKLAFYRETNGADSAYNKESDLPSDLSSHEHKLVPPVSVIICEHNDAHLLLPHLDRFLNQSARSVEVLIISHNSIRKFEYIIRTLQREKTQLRLIEHRDGKVGKKFALARGIQEATHEVLLLTDADCYPASDKWVEKMAAKFRGEVDIVLGFSPYTETPGFLNRFIRYEACYTAIQYFSFALAGLPYMGVGRNLAYTKTLYQHSGGFQRHQHLAPGDDDLFVNQAARPKRISIQTDPDTFVYSRAKKSWTAYCRQKSRHLSTGKLYKLHHQLLLGLLAMSHVLHYVGGILLAIEIDPFHTLSGYVVRIGVVTVLSRSILCRLQHRKLWPWVPALDACMVLYYLVLAPRVLRNTNAQRWN